MTETYDKFKLTALANSTKPKNHSTNPFLPDFEKNESTSNDNDDTEGCANSDVCLEYQMKRIHELKQQKELHKNIVIYGISNYSDENLIEIFDKICHILHVDETPKAVVKIYRASSVRVIVQFDSFLAKMQIFNAYKSHRRLMSGDIFKLESIESQNQIFIDSHLTKWYAKMMTHAKRAKKDGLIFKYWLTMYGLAIIKSPNAIADYCLSSEDIDQIIYDF